jgi:hypothetical protein
MAWKTLGHSQGVYHSVGWAFTSGTFGVFTAVPLGNLGTLRLLDKRIHLAALDNAGQKLHQLLRKSGKE